LGCFPVRNSRKLNLRDKIISVFKKEGNFIQKELVIKLMTVMTQILQFSLTFLHELKKNSFIKKAVGNYVLFICSQNFLFLKKLSSI
jgi:hypothetical protein